MKCSFLVSAQPQEFYNSYENILELPVRVFLNFISLSLIYMCGLQIFSLLVLQRERRVLACQVTNFTLTADVY